MLALVASAGSASDKRYLLELSSTMAFDPTTPNWKLVVEALLALNGVASIPELEAYFRRNFPPEKRVVNVRPDATALTVNANSRIHYGSGKLLRRTDSGNPYDRLFRRSDGRYEIYDPAKHGVWEIACNEQGNRYVRQIEDRADNASCPVGTEEVEEALGDGVETVSTTSTFAMESHLRDYIAQNIGWIEGTPSRLELFIDESGIPGVEYRTGVGVIDILARGSDDALYVLELKVSRGSDAVIGQILRYMAWVRSNMAKGRPVYGIVVSSTTSEKLKYAASEVSGIYVMEYELQFSLRHAKKL